MEYNRNYLLFLGMLFIFLGSEIGQTICQYVLRIVRFVFYLTIALVAAVGAIFFAKLGRILSGYANHKKAEQKK